MDFHGAKLGVKVLEGAAVDTDNFLCLFIFELFFRGAEAVRRREPDDEAVHGQAAPGYGLKFTKIICQ